jgi:hypothetical protein
VYRREPHIKIAGSVTHRQRKTVSSALMTAMPVDNDINCRTIGRN